MVRELPRQLFRYSLAGVYVDEWADYRSALFGNWCQQLCATPPPPPSFSPCPLDPSSASVLTECKPQPADAVRPCPCCLNLTSHLANRCSLRPLSTAVRHTTTTATTRPGRGSNTTSAGVTTVGGNHV